MSIFVAEEEIDDYFLVKRQKKLSICVEFIEDVILKLNAATWLVLKSCM